MISPLYVANNMILRARKQGINLTNLKLQKLLYILYARYYHDAGYSLFPDRFEAWQYGPVLTNVYEVFKKEEANTIIDLRPDANGEVLIASEKDTFGASLDFVWANYARKTAAYLVGLTHGKENPGYTTAWKKAVDSKGYEAFIEDSDIKEDGEKWFG